MRPGPADRAERDPALVEQMLALLSAADRHAAGRLCAALVELGVPLHHLVDQGLAPAMARVGTLLEAAAASMTDEHQVASAAQGALSAAAGRAGRSPKGPRTAVVACADGDWHSLPARMIAEVLVADGWSVRFLGASRSSRSLVSHLSRQRPDVVLLGCALTTSLPALMHAVQQVHVLEIPVCVGGWALGTDPRRADTLGADGWAGDAGGVLRLLSAPLVCRPGAGSAPAYADYLELRAGQRRWVGDALAVTTDHFPVGSSADPHAGTRDHLARLLDIACIAVLLDDVTVMDDECASLSRMLAARGTSVAVLRAALLALSTVRPARPSSEAVDAVLRRALEQHVERPSSPSNRAMLTS